MRRLIAAVVATLAFAAPAQAYDYSPTISRAAGEPTYTWATSEWSKPRALAFYKPDPSRVRTIGDEKVGIHLSRRVHYPLSRVMNGWRFPRYSDRVWVAQAIFVLAHEVGHARNANVLSEHDADVYAINNWRGIATRMGLGPYHRRALSRVMFLHVPE